jgi:GT2 family glycosyltransferase
MLHKASVIISVYNNTEFLQPVLDSLKLQTEKNFEIVISEDAQHTHMKVFIDQYIFENDRQHLTQEDIGWQKNRALNNAIKAAKSDWLIFIDGDCVLHPRFVEMHLRYADERSVLAGKRVKLDETISRLLIQNISNLDQIQSILKRRLFSGKGKIRFIEEGIFIPPDSLLGFIPKIRRLNHLKGCNMSFSRVAIETINGFDEDYVMPAIGEDTDLSWRFEAAGFKHKSLRNLAVQYHLWHAESWVNQDDNQKMMLEKQAGNEYICKNGLKKI